MSVDAEGLQGRIELETVELRGTFPVLESCESALAHWTEDGAARYSLCLDIRAPQYQTLVSGSAQASPVAAAEAAFRSTREQLRRSSC